MISSKLNDHFYCVEFLWVWVLQIEKAKFKWLILTKIFLQFSKRNVKEIFYLLVLKTVKEHSLFLIQSWAIDLAVANIFMSVVPDNMIACHFESKCFFKIIQSLTCRLPYVLQFLGLTDLFSIYSLYSLA